jgi:hypothetical protein
LRAAQSLRDGEDRDVDLDAFNAVSTDESDDDVSGWSRDSVA